MRNKITKHPFGLGKRGLIGLAISLCTVVTLSLCFSPSHAADPGGGSISPTGAALNWIGNAAGTGGTGGEGQCIDSGPAQNCDSFTLNVSGADTDWTGKLIQIRVNWSLQASDYDL